MSFSKVKESPKDEVNAILVFLCSLTSNKGKGKGKEGKYKASCFLLKSEINYGSFWRSPQIKVFAIFLEPFNIVIFKLFS